MNKACSADKVKTVSALGHPEFGVCFGSGRCPGGAVQGILRFGQVLPDDVAFFALNHVRRLIGQAGSIGIGQFALLEQEAMIGRHDDR